MQKFMEKIKQISKENEKIAIFVDMDGTIAVYNVYQDESVSKKMEDEYLKVEPVNYVINVLEQLDKLENVDIYILTLSRTLKITEQKKEWLRKNVPFVKENNWIIITKEINEYSKENRDIVKAEKMNEKCNEYNKLILLDDDHKILKETQKMLGDYEGYFIFLQFWYNEIKNYFQI